MSRYIEESWERYRAVVLPGCTNTEQLADMRRTFFAGAALIFKGILLNLSDEEDATEGDLNLMSSVNAELNEFGQQLDADVLGIQREPAERPN